MFLSEVDEVNEDGSTDHTSNETGMAGELELMIAEPSARRKGYGKSALMLFMSYILAHVDRIGQPGSRLLHFTVKIGSANKASLALFEGIGFKRERYVEFFKEWELRLVIDDILRANLRAACQFWSEHVVE